MNVCFPATQDLGLDSPVSRHFGSAPLFVLVDTASREPRALSNGHAAHEHGACRPLDPLAGENIDAVVVGGIGPGALQRLRAAGIVILRAGAPTIRGCLDEIARGEAREVAPADACASHAHDQRPQ